MIKKLIVCTVALICLACLLVPVIDSYEDEHEAAIDRLEVLVIEGQSNAAYRNANVSLVNQEIDLPSHNAYYYGTDSAPIYYGQTPETGGPTYDETFESYSIHSMIEGNKWKVGGYEPILAKYISDKTGSDVLIINAGISGASIQYLQPDADGGEYVAEVIAHALADIDPKYTVDKVGYMWLQGEANRWMEIDEYIAYFDVVNAWNISQGFDKGYIVQTRPYNGMQASDAQLKMCNEIPNIVLSSTAPSTFTVDNGKLALDNIHYSQWGRMIVAEDVCNTLQLPEPQMFTSGEISLLKIVPLMVIVGILIVAVGWIALRRQD